jgi:hypothetical protein
MHWDGGFETRIISLERSASRQVGATWPYNALPGELALAVPDRGAGQMITRIVATDASRPTLVRSWRDKPRRYIGDTKGKAPFSLQIPGIVRPCLERQMFGEAWAPTERPSGIFLPDPHRAVQLIARLQDFEPQIPV